MQRLSDILDHHGAPTVEEAVEHSGTPYFSFKDLDENKERIGNEIRKALEAKNTIGLCHKTGHPLVMRRSKAGKRFVGCAGWPNCDVTYPLPQFGKIVGIGSEKWEHSGGLYWLCGNARTKDTPMTSAIASRVRSS